MEKNKGIITIKVDVKRNGYKTLKTGVEISEEMLKATSADILKAALVQIEKVIVDSKILKINEVKK